MKFDIVKVCAGLIIILALLMGSSIATETTWRFSGFELYGYDINFTSHNATNVKNIDAENITSKKIGGVIYADQYNSLQSALNQSDGILPYEKIIISGNYTVSSDLYVPSYTIIDMTSANITSTCTLFRLSNADGSSPRNHIEIYGGTIDGSNSGSYIGVFGIGGVHDIYIHNMNIINYGTGSDEGIYLKGYNILVENNYFTGIQGIEILSGKHSTDSFDTYNIVIRGNTINASSSEDAIALYLGVDSRISENYIEGNNYSVTIRLYGPGKNNIISDNHIVNSTSTGIIEFSLDATGIPENTIVCNNFIKNNAIYSGVKAMYFGGSGAHRPTNAQIYGNQMYNTSIGIHLYYVNEFIITNNIFKDVTTPLLIDTALTSSISLNYGVAPFDWGNHATAPSTPFGAGDTYYNTTDNKQYSYTGIVWDSISAGEYYGEGYFYNNAVATVIETANTPIALRGATQGQLKGITYDAGSTGSITAYADGTGGTVLVSDAGHGLSNGDIITIRGTTNYNGIFEISSVTTDTFKIIDTWVNDNGASDWDQPGIFTVPAGGAGIYRSAGFICTAPAGACELSFATYMNTTIQTNTVTCRDYAINDKDTVTSSGLFDLGAGDRIWVAVQSDSTNDITNINGNFNIRRIT